MADPQKTVSVECALDALDDLFNVGEPEVFNDYGAIPEGLVVKRRGLLETEVPAYAGRLVVFSQYHTEGRERPVYDIKLYRLEEDELPLGVWGIGKGIKGARAHGVFATQTAVPKAAYEIARSTVPLPAILWRQDVQGPELP